MGRYASNTEVSVDRSQAEIRKTIERYGGDNVVIGTSRSQRVARIQFSYKDMPLQISVNLPDPNAKRFWHTLGGRRRRNSEVAYKEWEKDCRRLWRVLLLLVKAQFEVIENHVLSAEEVFLPWLLLTDGQTVAERNVPLLSKLLDAGGTGRLLLTNKKGESDAT